MFRLSPQPAPDTLAMLELTRIPPSASLCLVEPLPVLSDAEAVEFEGAEGDSGLVDTLSLTPATATALNRFQRVVTKFGDGSSSRQRTGRQLIRSIFRRCGIGGCNCGTTIRKHARLLRRK